MKPMIQLDAVLRKMPAVYQEYRLRASEVDEFYRSEAMSAVNDRCWTLEIDCLIFVALLIVRDAFGRDEFVHRPAVA